MCSHTTECVLILQNVFSIIECVLILSNASSYYSRCSLTIECVLQGDVQVREKVECLDAVLQNVFSYYRMCSAGGRASAGEGGVPRRRMACVH